jgi:hypothetical protein
MSSLTGRPSIPPALLTWLAQRLYPFWNARPSTEKSPVRESDAPMTMGVLLLVPDDPLLLLLLVLLLLRQPAASAAATQAAANRAKNRAR